MRHIVAGRQRYFLVSLKSECTRQPGQYLRRVRRSGLLRLFLLAVYIKLQAIELQAMRMMMRSLFFMGNRVLIVFRPVADGWSGRSLMIARYH